MSESSKHRPAPEQRESREARRATEQPLPNVSMPPPRPSEVPFPRVFPLPAVALERVRLRSSSNRWVLSKTDGDLSSRTP